MDCNFEDLALLLKASSRDVVGRLCDAAFLHRHVITLPDDVISTASQDLSSDQEQAKKCMTSLCGLVVQVVFQGSTEATSLIGLFPTDFHKNLRDLLVKILTEKIPNWKSQANCSLSSLPRLVDFDWNIDVKAASAGVARTSVPTCHLKLQVEDRAQSTEETKAPQVFNVELPKETLDTVLDGLGRIRDQLSAVAVKPS